MLNVFTSSHRVNMRTNNNDNSYHKTILTRRTLGISDLIMFELLDVNKCNITDVLIFCLIQAFNIFNFPTEFSKTNQMRY